MDPQDGSEDDVLHEAFVDSDDFELALADYADDFQYSVEYEIAFERWREAD